MMETIVPKSLKLARDLMIPTLYVAGIEFNGVYVIDERVMLRDPRGGEHLLISQSELRDGWVVTFKDRIAQIKKLIGRGPTHP